MVAVQVLRDEAAVRAASRPRLPFDGTVEDGDIEGVPIRHYAPSKTRRPATAYFAHGGYGLFGTLDLQDGYCRTLAQGLGCDVVAVAYRLAPEHTFTDSVDDLVTAARTATHNVQVILAGDSAGGAIAVAATLRLPDTRALLLTNPNLDLTLASFDPTAPDGPDAAVSQFAFTAWARPYPLSQAPRLHRPHQDLPGTFIAVGDRDALLPEARALTEHLQQHHRTVALLELPDTGHGFAGDPQTARRVVDSMSTFLTGSGR